MLGTATMPLKPAYPPGGQRDFNAMDLLSIFEPDRQINVIARPAQAAIIRYLQQVCGRMGAGYRLALRPDLATPARLDSEMHLPDVPDVTDARGKEALLADISTLVSLYADLMDCHKVGIRLEVLTHAMCPRFHIDRTGIRLLCTYLGPGTEWLEAAFCNSKALTARYADTDAFHQALILHPQGVRQAPAQALVLLKGSMWQGNQQAGIVHRSPQITGTANRVVLALDAIW
ncbi:DUF1826 domain-containing protein [Methylophilus sp.]|uniref:DUF1826 domain-containing protein n=1 Tax=Methylophilus sp. TaxID=29541 RepID=UPI0040360269